MDVTLTPEQQAFVDSAVKSGRYASAQEAIQDAVHLLAERDAKHQRLRRDIEMGLESGEAGELDEATVEDIKSRGRARLAAKHAAE